MLHLRSAPFARGLRRGDWRRAANDALTPCGGKRKSLATALVDDIAGPDMAATFLSYAGAIWWCIAVALLAFTLVCGLAQPFVQRRRARAAAKPPVSVILPIKLLDPGFERAQRSVFEQDYPDYEILISAAEVKSPALNAARAISASQPTAACRFIHSKGNAAVSPKLNNLIAPLAEARHDHILTKDSNITLGARCAFGFPAEFRAGRRPRRRRAGRRAGGMVGGWIEASIINAHARLLLSASTLGLGFGIGKIMALRRSDLERAGGVAAMSRKSRRGYGDLDGFRANWAENRLRP